MSRFLLWVIAISFMVGWRFSFYIDTDRQTELTIGMEKGATDGFDRELDQVAPPLPPEGSHSFFPIKDQRYSFIEALWRDIRAPQERAVWKITTVNLEKEINIIWDPDSLPQGDIRYNDSISLQQYQSGKLNIGMAKTFTLVYYRKPLPSRISEPASFESTFTLENPSPNPFNAVVNINFTLPLGKHDVRISIIDITGHIVRELYSGRLDGGRFRIFWDGRDEQNKNLPSGVYFISLTKGDEKIVKRIVLMR